MHRGCRRFLVREANRAGERGRLDGNGLSCSDHSPPRSASYSAPHRTQAAPVASAPRRGGAGSGVSMPFGPSLGVLVLVLGLSPGGWAQSTLSDTTRLLSLVVNAELWRDTISPHIYGQFDEPLGRDIYD